jgi:hypothetical protein
MVSMKINHYGVLLANADCTPFGRSTQYTLQKALVRGSAVCLGLQGTAAIFLHAQKRNLPTNEAHNIVAHHHHQQQQQQQQGTTMPTSVSTVDCPLCLESERLVVLLVNRSRIVHDEFLLLLD